MTFYERLRLVVEREERAVALTGSLDSMREKATGVLSDLPGGARYSGTWARPHMLAQRIWVAQAELPRDFTRGVALLSDPDSPARTIPVRGRRVSGDIAVRRA